MQDVKNANSYDSMKLIKEVSSGNEFAYEVLMKVFRLAPNYATVVTLALRKYDVKGDMVETLYKKCCQGDIGIFLRTVNLFLGGKYSKTAIHNRIAKNEAFIKQ